MNPRSASRFVFRDVLIPLALAMVLALVIQATVAKPFEIPTASMDPTVKPGDRVLANRVVYHFRDIHRGDIIVFNPPKELDSNVPFVKRVVGLPGDTVEVRTGKTLVNGQVFQVDGADTPTYNYGPKKVPQGQLFVLGDNRNNSVDSHYWGFLSDKDVIGAVFMTYWPLTRLHVF
jgi:signal peptidase I